MRRKIAEKLFEIPVLGDYPAQVRPAEAVSVSVITVVRNGAPSLQRTIDSVRNQRFCDFEYIVVDGGSTDGTQEIVAANRDVVTFTLSENDRGISDGFNKGIALACGKYVTLIHADDWLSEDQIELAVQRLESSGADFVFGDLVYHSADGVASHVIHGDPSYAARIGHVMPALNHSTVVARRDAYMRAGLFDLTMKLAMDYELLLRFHRAGLKGVYDPHVRGHMSLDGASDRRSFAALAEVRDASIRHGHPIAMAHARFLYRCAKMWLRQRSDQMLPRSLHLALRKRVNKNFDNVS